MQLNRKYDWLAYVGVGLSVLVVSVYFSSLPNKIPIHFDIHGTPDGFGSKYYLLLLLLINFALFIILGLSKSSITKAKRSSFQSGFEPKEGMKAQFIAQNLALLGALRALTTLFFGYLSWATIQTALSQQNGLGSWVTVAFLVVILGTTGYHTYQISKYSK